MNPAGGEPPRSSTDTWFRRLADASQDLVYVYQFDPPTFVYVSPSAQHILGYTPDAFYSDPLLANRLIHPDDAPIVRQFLGTSDAYKRIEVRCRHQDGRTIWLEQHNTALRGPDGRVMVVHGAARDITERKTAESGLRESEGRYRALFEAHPQPMWVYDPETLRFLVINEAACEFYGYTREEFRAMTILDIRPEDDRDSVRQQVSDSTGPRRTGQYRHCKKSGELVDAFVSSHPFEFAGRPARLVMVQDVTEQRRAEEERASLQRAFWQSQKMESVGRLAGGVAHDFNNLLTVIAGYGRLLMEEPGVAHGVREKLTEIVHATDRAQELTRKLLIFSRKHPYEPRIVGIDAFVAQEARMLPRLIGEHIRVEKTLGAPDAFVRIDPAQLTQILINLVVNARDAMPEGGTLTLSTARETVKSRLSLMPQIQPGDYARITVADTGFGMTPEVQAHLFEPFFTTKQLERGTGLGLATVYGLVQQAGGFIDVRSAENAGTSMIVYLPLSQLGPSADVTEQAPEVQGGRESILLVEDEPSVRALTTTILTRLGYRVVAAEGPAEALALVRTGLAVDLVITDVVMPGMKGHRLVRELERYASGFAVLYVSGFAETGPNGTDELHADVHHFLAKPFTPTALARKTREVLDARPRSN